MPKRHTNWLVTFRNSKNITMFLYIYVFSFQKCCPWRESLQLINSDSNFKGPKQSLPKFITVGGAKQGKIPPINKGHRAGKGVPPPFSPPGESREKCLQDWGCLCSIYFNKTTPEPTVCKSIWQKFFVKSSSFSWQ